MKRYTSPGPRTLCRLRVLSRARRTALTAPLLVGLLATHGQWARADETLPLPLSGAAYHVAQSAYAAYDAHRYADSVQFAREAIRQRPDVIDLRVLLANALADGGHRRDAQKELDLAIRELGPVHVLVARRAQIEALLAAGERGEAADLPGEAGIEARAAYRAYDRKDYAGAIEHAQHAIAVAPEVERLRYLLIDALYESKRDNDAYVAAQNAAQDFGDNAGLRERRRSIGARLAPGVSAAALEARQRNDLDDAEKLARAAIVYAPDRQGFRMQLLDVLLARGDMPGAEAAASEAIDQDSTDIFAWTLRGYARAAQHKRTADEDFVHALQIQPDLSKDSADAARSTRDKRMASAIIADVWLARNRPEAALQLLASLKPAHDDTDAAIALRRLRAKRMMSAAALPVADKNNVEDVDPRARPVFDCHEDEFGASCDLYASDPGFAMMRDARAATQSGNRHAAVESLREAVNAVPDDPQYRVALIDALLADGAAAQARQEARATIAAGLTDEMDPLQVAYLAQRAGDNRRAYQSFLAADRDGALPVASTADAGYTALQVHQNQQGAQWLERAIDNGQDSDPPMTPQALLDAQSAHADATRNWGLTTSLNYRSGLQEGMLTAPTPGIANNWQAGTEVYWRPFGSLGERAFELYARGNENFGVQGNEPSGIGTLQAALGARVKPFTSTNAVFAFERILPIGSSVRGDWLARASWSGGFGTEKRVDVPSWWSGVAYSEVGHYIEHPSTYATANFRLGRTFRVDAIDSRLTVFPHLVLGADYDSAIDHSTPVGVGAGVAARFWFRGGQYDAPRSFVDVSLQYRVRVAGDTRARGVFFGAVFSY